MSEPIRTSDGELLSVKLKKTEGQRRRTALLLVTPLLLFILLTYLFPIAQMLVRSVDNTQMNSLLVKTHSVIQKWDGKEKNLVLVTHYSIITAVTNAVPSSGEIVITDKNFKVLGTVITD